MRRVFSFKARVADAMAPRGPVSRSAFALVRDGEKPNRLDNYTFNAKVSRNSLAVLWKGDATGDRRSYCCSPPIILATTSAPHRPSTPLACRYDPFSAFCSRSSV